MAKGSGGVGKKSGSVSGTKAAAKAATASARDLMSAPIGDFAAGASVWVDLCMPEAHADLVLAGVPRGWQRYATAGWDRRVADLDTELAWAVERSAGALFTLLVYGGGREVRAWCEGRAGALHCPRAADSRHRPGEGTRRRLLRENV